MRPPGPASIRPSPPGIRMTLPVGAAGRNSTACDPPILTVSAARAPMGSIPASSRAKSPAHHKPFMRTPQFWPQSLVRHAPPEKVGFLVGGNDAARENVIYAVTHLRNTANP